MRSVTSILVVSIVLAFGGVRTVSAGSDEDLARVLAGIATVAIIAKAIEDRKDRAKAEKAKGLVLQLPRKGNVVEGRIRPHHKYRHRGYRQYPLPVACRVVVDTYQGAFAAYGRRCLDKRYQFSSKLPRSCETIVRTPYGYRTVYGARCLDRDGWRVARR